MADGQISRQLKWQRKKQKEGKCCTCGKPLFSKWHCKRHTLIQREATRVRFCKKVGKDIDTPLTKTGRKRIEEVKR